MNSGTIRLTQKQVNFIVEYMEISDVDRAIDAFASLMLDERADPQEMPMYIDRIMKKAKK